MKKYSFNTILYSCFLGLFVLVFGIRAEETSVEERTKRFDVDQSTVDEAFQKTIAAMFETSIYSLDSVLNDLTRKGNLNDALEVKNMTEGIQVEQKNFLESGTLSSAASLDVQAKLLPVRRILQDRRNIQIKAENEFKRKSIALLKDYLADLNDLVKETTRQGDLNKAKAIRQTGDEVQTKLDEMQKPSDDATLTVRVKLSEDEKPDVTPLSSAESQELAALIKTLPGGKHRPLTGGHNNGGLGTVSPDETKIFCPGYTKPSCLFDFESGKILTELPIPKNTYSFARFHPEEARFFFSIANRSTVQSWNLDTFKRMKDYDFPSSSHVRFMDLAPDGSFAVSGCADNKLIVWNTNTGRILQTFTCPGPVSRIAIHPNSRIIASTGNNQPILLWNLKDRKPPQTLGNKDISYSMIAFSSDGKRLGASGGQYVQIWSYPSGKPWRLIGGYGREIRGFDFNADGRYLATGDDDFNLVIWNAATRKPVLKDSRNQGGWLRSIYYCKKRPNTVIVLAGESPDIHTFPPISDTATAK